MDKKEMGEIILKLQLRVDEMEGYVQNRQMCGCKILNAHTKLLSHTHTQKNANTHTTRTKKTKKKKKKNLLIFFGQTCCAAEIHSPAHTTHKNQTHTHYAQEPHTHVSTHEDFFPSRMK